MQNKKNSLQEEQTKVEEKLNELNEFNQSEEVEQINEFEKFVLRIQAGALYTYNECLKARLEML